MYRGKGTRESSHDDLFNRTTARKHDKNLMETIILDEYVPRMVRESELVSPD